MATDDFQSPMVFYDPKVSDPSRSFKRLRREPTPAMDNEEIENSGSKPKSLAFTSKELLSFTNNFDERNRIGSTQFGELYRGKFQLGSEAQDVAVKIWNEKSDRLIGTDDYLMVKEEVMFLTHPTVNHHPNLVNLIGYCTEEQVKGVVYDLCPLDTLQNVMMKDDFNWLQRIKVALGFARLLEFLHDHEKPYLVFNIDAHHIMLDQECNPILFDFGLLSGGIIGEISFPKLFIPMSPGYVDSCFAVGGPRGIVCDVFSYGVILLGLIAKRLFDEEKLLKGEWRQEILFVDEWAKSVYKPSGSLVHSSLEKDLGYYGPDALIITQLGMRCVTYFPPDRPTMKEVVEWLEHLQVVERHGDALASGKCN